MNKILLIVTAFLLFNIGYAQQLKTWTGATSTAWDADTNWSPIGKPTAAENVLITNTSNQPVITTAGAACATLQLLNSTAGSIVVLTIKGGAFSPTAIVMNSNGGDTSICSLNIETGRVSVTGNVTMTGSALQNSVTFSGDGNLSIGGLMTGGTLNSVGKGTVTYNGTGTRAVGNYNYYNLTLSGSGVRTISSSDVIVNGTLSMAGLAKASAAPTYGSNAALQYNSGSSIEVGPEWISPFIAKGGIEISSLTGASTVTINGAGVEKRFNDGVPLIIDEDATLLVNNSDIYFGGDLINNRGTLNTDSYVYLTGNINQSIDSFVSTKGVVMNKNAGTATFTGNIDTKELVINGLGTLNLGSGWTHTFTDWIRTKGTLNGSSSILKFSGNVIGTGSDFIAGTGTVEFNGAAQNLGTGSITYNNLTLSGSGTKTFGAKTTIKETFSIASGAIADLTTDLVHSAKSIQLGLTAGAGGSWGSSASKAVNKNDTFFVSNNGIVNVGPTIVISTDSIAALTSVYGTPSTSNSFTVSGIDMLNGILVTAPLGFEVSLNGTTFTDTVTIGAAGTIASTTIYVRLKGTVPAKDYSGNIVLTSNGTTNVNIAIATSTVNKAPLTITTIDNERKYGAENPALTAAYVGFVNGDTEASLTTPVKIETTAVKTSSVGSYTITASEAASSNYTITYGTKGSLKITPVDLTISTNNATKTYGSENPVLTATYVGFVNGDTEATFTTPVKIETTAVKTSPVGNYTITASEAVSPNYTISYGTKGSLEVTPAVLTINTNNATKTYGSENPALTATYVGFVNADTEATFTTPVKIETTAVKTSPVGNYTITASGAVSPNYTISYGTKGSLEITPVALTINTNNATKVYGSENPVLTATYVGFVNGDTEAAFTTPVKIETTAVKTSPVGNYTITASGAVSPNYTISYGTKGSLEVTPAVLTINTNNATKVYGSENPALAATYVGFVNGDTEATFTTPVKIETTAVKESAVGNYVITASEALSPNYTISYGTKGSLAVTPAALKITADNVSKAQGSENPTLTATYAGFVNGDTESSLATPVKIATTAVKESPAGSYTITVSEALSPNYTIEFTPGVLTVIASSNAGMTDLAISEGTLSPAFAEDTKDYTVTVPNDVAGITVTPTTEDPTATVTVNGKEVPSGTPSSEILLEVGENTITTVITAQDGTTNTYVIVVTKEPSNNSGLTDLAISEGTLNPAFAEGTKDYTASVPNNITNITVTPTTADATATVTVNGKEVPSGTPSSEIPLQVGENTITTVITAQDGTTTNYTVVVTREPSNNSGLTDLAISEGTLSPAFAEGTKDYTATVPNTIEGITVTPTTADATATVTVNGKEVPSGTPSEEIPLQVGENSITTVITAQDGTTTTYTVVVTREPSNNSGATDLTISEGTLSPAFAENTKDYTATVPNNIEGITVTPTTADATATVTVNGKEVASGTPSEEIKLQVGENIITTVITAQDGTTTNTYTIVVTREETPKSSNAGLADIIVSEGTLSPAFDTDTKDYKVDVPNDTNSIIVTPITIDPTATVEIIVDGKPVNDNTAPIDLNVGDNVITVVVTAEDGTQETYTVVVDRADAPPSSNAGMTDLTISEGTLSPAFAEDTKDYTVTVPNDVAGITVTPTTEDPNATVTVNGKEVPSGTPSSEIPLQVGENTITTVVTALDGTTNTYVIVVTREEAPASDNAGLSDIVVSDGTLSPAFDTDTKDYTVDVPNETNTIIVTPITIDPNATVEIKVDGITVNDNTAPIDLHTGDNVITIVVTAEDGTQETYVVIVDRADAEPQAVIPTNIITPNGDGKNDTWVIPGIDKYPNNSVKVFDRAARLVYSKDNYNNDWDGTFKGSPLSQDTYYYLIDLGSGLPKIKGFISIIRD